ncbi:phosphatases II [Neolentinus lepideus HHB14362 ss-1]|uniref:Phosphatases II n=1 Tax=Neolentinus lepideus HHB14362 ss-1 TaxID=1314782 RepID=A0A165UDD4_9AGAM|nr:phosphatases II [Neolentinus lepideus HHB14362 ss-1]
MSSTLVETFETRPSSVEVAQWRAVGQQGAYPGLTPQLELVTPEERLAAQIYHLASQHHMSEYNRQKFGPQGSPSPYVPLSIQYPDHVRELQAVQARLMGLRAWWPGSKSLPQEWVMTSSEPPSPVPQIISRCDVVGLQSELSAAIEETPLAFAQQQQQQQQAQFPIKTSATHPINISMVIPPELISIMSTHLVRPQQPSPTVLEVPPAYSLERLIFQPPPYYFSSLSTTPMRQSFTYQPRLSKPLPKAKEFATVFSNGTSFTKAMRAAMECKLPGLGRKYPFSDADAVTVTVAAVQSTYHLLTRCPSRKSSSRERPLPIVPSKRNITGDEKPRDSVVDLPERQRSTEGFVPGVMQMPTKFTIGNLYLSSCPGKKVRLDGPVKGRGTVCRDLRSDLKRIKELGVGCVICCLDDIELEFLGASWTEYSCIAHELGLDVLRIPTPEGLAPFTPGLLDEYLSKLIEAYTIQGIHILAHCRGGVGRAGLIACCWVLKLGLCGWIETDPVSQSDEIRRDTMQLVERVIALIRRRRSTKAIETYEQVKFLVDFVEYLRARRGRGIIKDLRNDFAI